jgi:hypothetical protein
MDDRAFFLYGGGFPKELRVCDVCGDSVIVRRFFVCIVENNADSFRNVYLHALYIYIYIYVCIIYICIMNISTYTHNTHRQTQL